MNIPIRWRNAIWVTKPFRNSNTERNFLREKLSKTVRASKIIYLSLALGLIAIEVNDVLSGYSWIPLKAHIYRMALVLFLFAYVAIIHYNKIIIELMFVPIFVATGIFVLGMQHYLEFLSRNDTEPGFYFLSTASLTYMQLIGLFAFLRPELKISFPVSIGLVLLTRELAGAAYPSHTLAIERLFYYQCAAVFLGLVIYYWTIKDERRMFLKNKRLKRSAILQKKLAQAQEAANEAKTRFLSTVGHEMRTPMSAIINTLNLLELRGVFADDSTAKLSGDVHQSCDRLLSTMNNMLDYAHGETGGMSQLRNEIFQCRTLANSIEGLFRATALNRQLELCVRIDGNDDLPLFADFEKLNRVLVNLVSNALKFTPAGKVELRVKRSPGETAGYELIRCDVIDTGIGIHADEIQKIFRPFYQVDSARSRRFQGSGLGLSICKQLVDALNGKITVKSELGIGTHFTVEIVALIAEQTKASNSPH